jgi:ABC-type polysaccharide/polyol phosphate export permease
MTTAIKFQQVTRPPSVDRALTLVGNYLTLCGALLLAAQARLQIPLGESMDGRDYVAQTPLAFLALAAAALAVWALTPLHTRLTGWIGQVAARWLGVNRPYRRYLLMVLIAAPLLLVAMPQIRLLQIAYFVIFGALLGVVAIAAPARFYLNQPGNDVVSDLARLWRNRFLAAIWLRHNIESRYAQQTLGILWIILLPVSTSIVLSVAFSQFMRVQMDVPFVPFYLAALVHYNLFSGGLSQAAVAISNRVGIISQVYFPREILLVIILGELLVDFVFTFTAMLIINALFGILPNEHYWVLPFLWLILLLIVAGLMLTVSALSVIVRDIPQLVQVALQLLFFLTPVIYPITSMPERFRFLFIINPLAPLVQSFRDVIVYNRSPDAVTLFYPLVFGGALLVFGYTLFKSIEDRMADML